MGQPTLNCVPFQISSSTRQPSLMDTAGKGKPLSWGDQAEVGILRERLVYIWFSSMLLACNIFIGDLPTAKHTCICMDFNHSTCYCNALLSSLFLNWVGYLPAYWNPQQQNSNTDTIGYYQCGYALREGTNESIYSLITILYCLVQSHKYEHA